MANVFSNKNSIYCVIRQQWFNKISSEKLSDLKLVLKDCDWTPPKKTWAHFFYQIKLIVFERVQLQKSLLSYSATFFLTGISRMVNFDTIWL